MHISTAYLIFSKTRLYMNKIHTDWSLRNIIGNHGNATLQYNEINSRYQESVFTFHQPGLIEGRFQTFVSPNMEVSVMKMELQKDMVFRFDDGVKRMGTTFLLEGNIDSDCFYNKKNQPVDHSRHMFCYSRSYQSDYTLHAGKIRLFHINYKPEFLHAAAGDDVVQKLFGGVDPDNRCFCIPLGFTSQTGYHRIAQEITTGCYNNSMQHLVIEAKGMELLSLELEELLSAESLKAAAGRVSKPDREKLFAVREHIKQHYTDQLSLHQLALRFQLNEFKLKKGYKQLFNTTVFDHIFQLRMQEAKRLLETDEHSVADVAYTVGYSSPNNFATAFQRMFQYPPSQVSKRAGRALLCA